LWLKPSLSSRQQKERRRYLAAARHITTGFPKSAKRDDPNPTRTGNLQEAPESNWNLTRYHCAIEPDSMEVCEIR
jgi:hypothetical protein